MGFFCCCVQNSVTPRPVTRSPLDSLIREVTQTEPRLSTQHPEITAVPDKLCPADLLFVSSWREADPFCRLGMTGFYSVGAPWAHSCPFLTLTVPQVKFQLACLWWKVCSPLMLGADSCIMRSCSRQSLVPQCCFLGSVTCACAHWPMDAPWDVSVLSSILVTVAWFQLGSQGLRHTRLWFCKGLSYSVLRPLSFSLLVLASERLF